MAERQRKRKRTLLYSPEETVPGVELPEEGPEGPVPSTEGLEELLQQPTAPQVSPPKYRRPSVKSQEEPPPTYKKVGFESETTVIGGPSRQKPISLPLKEEPSAPPIEEIDPKSRAIAKEILREMTESEILVEKEKRFGGLTERVKKFKCGDKEFEPDVFKNYPDYPLGSQIPFYVWKALVEDIEKFVTDGLNFTLILCNNNSRSYQCQEKINNFVNFVKCFQQGGGKVSALGNSVYPEWFDMCFRIKWLLKQTYRKDLKEYLNPLEKDCKFNEWDFTKIHILYDAPINSLSAKDLNIVDNLGNPFLSAQLRYIKNYVDYFTSKKTKWNEDLYTKTPIKLKERVKCLLKRGIDPNQRNIYDNHTPLHEFMSNSYLLKLQIEVIVEIIRMLINAGADVNAINIYQNTPLIELLKKQVLMEYSKDDFQYGDYNINRREANNMIKKLVEIIRILISNGADPNIKNDDGESAFSLTKDPQLLDALKGGQSGGSFKYNGRKYKIHKGQRGGQYINVNGRKKYI